MKIDQKPIEYRTYTDNQTGEVHEVPVMNHYGRGNKDFDMIFYGHLLDILNDLGNKRIKVLQYIIKNRSKVDNLYVGTVRDIAVSLDISPTTVNATLLFLEDKGVIKRKTGVIYIDADLVCDGRFKGQIMHVYSNLEEESPEIRKAKLLREAERTLAKANQLRSLSDKIEIPAKNQIAMF